jgi:aminoglycoside phosphotransferase (APT) family kinase protein
VTAVSGAADAVDAPLVDPDRFAAWADGVLTGEDPITIERLREGHSNLTFVVRRTGREWILRRPPRGPLLPTAHDVLREFRVLDLLASTGSSARVPRVVAACEDEGVIGVPFYVMERAEGEVIRERLPAWLADDERDAPRRRELAFDLVDALAELHSTDPAPFVEAGVGRPSGYLARQVRRWRGQREGIQAAARERGTEARDLPDYDAVRDWLEANLPEETERPTVVHGDYKMDNVLSLPGSSETGEPPRVNAILDWEMATVGDPLADLGYLLSFWVEAGDDPWREALSGGVYSAIGMPTRDEVVERYGASTGRSMRDVRFYVTLAVWKLAILLEASYNRHLAGTTDDPFFALLDVGVPALLGYARRVSGA